MRGHTCLPANLHIQIAAATPAYTLKLCCIPVRGGALATQYVIASLLQCFQYTLVYSTSLLNCEVIRLVTVCVLGALASIAYTLCPGTRVIPASISLRVLGATTSISLCVLGTTASISLCVLRATTSISLRVLGTRVIPSSVACVCPQCQCKSYQHSLASP